MAAYDHTRRLEKTSRGNAMNIQHEPPHSLTCHRCGKPMEFHAEEVVGDARVAIFHCRDCDTLEAVEKGKAA